VAEVNLVIHGRNYNLSCDDGQEQRLADLAHYVDQRMKEIAKSGAAVNESHLFVLTSLIMADEVYDLKQNAENGAAMQAQNGESFKQEEAAIAHAIDQLADRIDHIADRIQKT